MGNNACVTYEVMQMLGHPECDRCESCGERWPSGATWFYVLRTATTTTTTKSASVRAMYCCGFCGATFAALQRHHEENRK